MSKWLSEDIGEMVRGEREELIREDRMDRWGERKKDEKWREERRKELRVEEVLRRMREE